MRWLVLLALTGACGRLGFEHFDGGRGGGGDGDGGPGDGAGADTANACAAGDGICRVSCLATDPDCTTTCGDGTCVGNAGELCLTCTECNTQSVLVCGNGQCDPGEDSDVCYADCGPTPWPWTADEADMVTRINNTRTAGYACPTSGTMTAPALTRASAIDAACREWSWEQSYGELVTGDSCNGRTRNDRLAAGGTTAANSAWVALGLATPQDALSFFLSGNPACLDFLNTAYTRIGIGISDAKGERAYVVMFD